MANYAIESAKELNNIGFATFVTTLCEGVFDAVLATQIKQLEAYAELTKSVAMSLTEYINNTKSEITLEEIQGFLAGIPLSADENGIPKTGSNLLPTDGGAIEDGDSISISKADLTTLSTNLSYSGNPSPLQMPTGDGPFQSTIGTILDAVAEKISANKYSFLESMISKGFSKIVFDEIIVQAGLNFSTAHSEYSSQVSESNANKNFSAGIDASFGKRGLLKKASKVFKIGAKADYAQVNVTANTNSSSSSGKTDVKAFSFVSLKARSEQ